MGEFEGSKSISERRRKRRENEGEKEKMQGRRRKIRKKTSVGMREIFLKQWKCA